MLRSRSPASQKAQHQVSAIWRVIGASQAAGVNFRLWIWPLSFHGSRQYLPSGIVRQVPPCTELTGLGGLSRSSFPCRPQSHGRVGCEDPTRADRQRCRPRSEGFQPSRPHSRRAAWEPRVDAGHKAAAGYGRAAAAGPRRWGRGARAPGSFPWNTFPFAVSCSGGDVRKRAEEDSGE